MIKNIIFDLGKVVLTNDNWFNLSEEHVKRNSEMFGATIEGMKKAWDKMWRPFELGNISEDEFFKGFIKESGARNTDLNSWKKQYRVEAKENENMLGFARSLKKNFRVYSITNIPKEWFSYKKEAFKLDEVFELIISSGEEGIKKPDLRIFEIFLERTGLDAESCLFIDNKEMNCDAAIKAGMKALIFTTQKKLEDDLASLLQMEG